MRADSSYPVVVVMKAMRLIPGKKAGGDHGLVIQMPNSNASRMERFSSLGISIAVRQLSAESLLLLTTTLWKTHKESNTCSNATSSSSLPHGRPVDAQMTPDPTIFQETLRIDANALVTGVHTSGRYSTEHAPMRRMDIVLFHLQIGRDMAARLLFFFTLGVVVVSSWGLADRPWRLLYDFSSPYRCCLGGPSKAL